MSDFETIKRSVNLRSIITTETGLQVKGHHLEVCPFCTGKDCFAIKEDYYKCFQCPASGDVFNFIQEFKEISSLQALKYLAGSAGITLRESKSAPIKLSSRDRIFILAADYYKEKLSNGGREYLIKKRGHTEAVLDKMKVGWTDGGLVEHLRSKQIKDTEILASGLAKEVKGKNGQDPGLADYFVKGLAIFPHFDRDLVLHFTIKDPHKKYKYQLPSKYRHKEWKFYNQGVISQFKEIILVEGENDALSLMRAGVKNVIALIGQVSKDQLSALESNFKNKHLYLWTDNDAPGEEYIRKIASSLSLNVRIIVYPAKYADPDEYVQGSGDDVGRRVRDLQNDATDFLSWEIQKIGQEESLETRLKLLKDRGIFAAVAEMAEADKEVFVEKMIDLRFSRTAIEGALEQNHDLKNSLAQYFEAHPAKQADPNQVADIIFRALSQAGKFYRDRDNNVYVMYRHVIYTIGTNRPFNALMKQITRLLPTREPGRSVWESLASSAFTDGKQIDLASWLYTDLPSDTVYVNLNSNNNKILKIAPRDIQELTNGINKDGVLLKSSNKIRSFNFHPDAGIREGLEVFKDVVFDNMTCPQAQRYLIASWFISAFLMDFSPYMGLMKFSGPSGSGKTTTAKLLSIILYGDEYLGNPSAAAAYAVASQNPILIIDNLESGDITKSIDKFLLLSATRGGKEKRKGGTETDTTEEKPRALVLITAIEPFTKAELINRTYDIDFDFRFKSDSYIENDAIRQILKKRDIVLSSILKFISKEILPALEERRDYITILKKDFSNHAKNRTDEYLALLMLILGKLIKYVPVYGPGEFLQGVETGEKEIREAWISFQNTKARETETSSNSIIKLLDGLVREYIDKMRHIEPDVDPETQEKSYTYTHNEYLLELTKSAPEVCKDPEGDGEYTRTTISFIATSGDIVAAFDRYCRNNGIKNPFQNAAVFSARLRNDKHLLKKTGWKLITKETDDPGAMWYRRIKGVRFFKFEKTIIR
jgi:DNA primase